MSDRILVAGIRELANWLNIRVVTETRYGKKKENEQKRRYSTSQTYFLTYVPDAARAGKLQPKSTWTQKNSRYPPKEIKKNSNNSQVASRKMFLYAVYSRNPSI